VRLESVNCSSAEFYFENSFCFVASRIVWRSRLMVTSSERRRRARNNPHTAARDDGVMVAAQWRLAPARVGVRGNASSSTQSRRPSRVHPPRRRSSSVAVAASASFPQPGDSKQINRGKDVADKLNDTSLFLIGIMGTGKSTVGAALAKTLGYNHLDTDDVIKSVTKKTVAEVFASVGEEEFRALESMILAEVAAYKRCVISTGGGIVCNKTNWMHLHNGVTLRLTADNQLLADRLYADGVEKRPLLRDSGLGVDNETAVKASIVKKLEALLEKRELMYKQADITIPLGSRDDRGASVAVVVDRILDALDARVSEDAVQNKLRRAPEVGEVTVFDPRGELGPKPKPRN